MDVSVVSKPSISSGFKEFPGATPLGVTTSCWILVVRANIAPKCKVEFLSTAY
jgi:hypothetical protein